MSDKKMCIRDREKTADGVQHLRHYQFEVDAETGQRGKEPLHDEHSHACLLYTSRCV